MFKTEDEMQVLFHDLLVEKEKKKAQGRIHYFREVDVIHFYPDIVGYSRPTDIKTYELKLKNCKKVWMQAYNNLTFGSAYVVLPSDQIDNALKYFNKNFESNELMKKVGLISFDGEKIKIVKRAKGGITRELIPGVPYQHYVANSNQLDMLDRLTRGFYHGGKNGRGREDRQGW